MKKISAVFLAVLLIVIPVQGEVGPEKTVGYLLSQVSAPQIGVVGGEWAVIGLARSGASVPEGYFEDYLRRVEQTVLQQQGILHQRKYTEYSRVILALHALGRDARNVAGYSLVAPLEEFEQTVWQGMNGAVWALLALDSHPAVAQEYQELRHRYLTYILQHQLSDGSFPLSAGSTQGDRDVTAMALQALAPYREQKEGQRAIDGGVSWLKSQAPTDAEQTAQIIAAFCSLGIPCTEEAFQQDGKTILQILMDYGTEQGAFRHTLGDTPPSLMATEQALCAMAAVQRAQSGAPALYDMRDARRVESATAKRHPEVKPQAVFYPERSFSDIGESPYRSHILSLAQRGILNGKGENCFDPDGLMTRAEFATIVVRSLGLPEKSTDRFGDVLPQDWFYGYVGTASAYGIVNGVSETAFQPDGQVTLQEAAVMLGRAAKLCGLETERTEAAILNTLAGFTDYRSVADWARESVAFCCDAGILFQDALELLPAKAINRQEIAGMVNGLLVAARL